MSKSKMNILAKDPNTLKRKAIKKRLSLWDSFFSKVHNKFVDSTLKNSDLDDGNDKSCLEDPKFLSINDEHNNLRRSLRIEHGINEESEISESEAEWQVCETSDIATDNDNLSGEALYESEVQVPPSDHWIDNDSLSGEAIREEKLSKECPRSYKRILGNRNNIQPQHQAIKASSTKKRSDNTVESSNSKKSKLDGKRTKSTDDAGIRKDKLKEKFEENTITEDYPDLKIRKGKVVAESRISLQNKEKSPSKVDEFSTSNEKTKEKRQSDPQEIQVFGEISKKKGPLELQLGPSKAINHPKNSRTDYEMNRSDNNGVNAHHVDAHSGSDVQQSSSHSHKNFSSDPDMTTDQINRKLKIQELCKQYDLWKLNERRKSGRLGSVHIVSDLNEEPTDANRLVVDLPPVVKNPFQMERRFSLQKCRF